MANRFTKIHHVSYEERTICSKVITTGESREPFFAVYDKSFKQILGSNPSIELALENKYPLFHEAGAFFPSQEAVYTTSGQFKPEGSSEPTIWLSKLSRDGDGRWHFDTLDVDLTMGNGGINYKSGVLFCDQGNKTDSGGLVLMEARPPYATTKLVDGFHGRQFNSVNDVVLHTDGSIWFTDPIYGYEQGFRPKPQLPCQVYRFDPEGGHIRVVADGFGRPNGLSFSPDEETMYITDTDFGHGDGSTDGMRVSTIYAYDVIHRHDSQFLANRRVFAMCDNGVPDGIKCDTSGNVYSGCEDGIHVWNGGGCLIGKIVIPGGVANFCFARNGELLVFNETRFWVVKIDGQTKGALLANLGIEV